jgi:hypothetical protein
MSENPTKNPEKGTPAWRAAILSVIPTDPGINSFESSEKEILIVKSSINIMFTTRTKKGESIIFNLNSDGQIASAVNANGLNLGRRYAPNEFAGIAHWLDDALEKHAGEIRQKFLPVRSPKIGKRTAETAKKALKQIPPPKGSGNDDSTGGITSTLGGIVVDK